MINRYFVITFAFQNFKYNMKNYFYRFLIFIVTISVLSSCLWDDEETELSDNPYFVSLKFSKNDSIPKLESAAFSLIYDSVLLDSVIVNLDSLPYQTRIDSVFPTFSFKSSSFAYLIMRDTLNTGLDTMLLTGKDTIDFTRVLRVVNIAQNGKDSCSYGIKVNVHQIQPELYVWQKTVDQIYTYVASVQKAVFFDGKYLFYVSSGLTNNLYISGNGVNWVNTPVAGLPPNVILQSITAFNNKLYLVNEKGLIYSSTDGVSWTGANPGVAGYTIENLYFVLDNQLWGLFKQDANSKYYFATTQDGLTWQIGETIPSKFPIVDYAALVFSSRTNKPKGLIIGGNASDSTLLSSKWSVQKEINNKYKWVDFSKDKPDLTALSGASLIHYDNKLLLFGGMDKDFNIVGKGYKESIDEGMTWRNTDSVYNVIVDTQNAITYQPRSYQSVIHDTSNHYIYLLGGRNNTSFFSDVWVGRLNRMTFIRK